MKRNLLILALLFGSCTAFSQQKLPSDSTKSLFDETDQFRYDSLQIADSGKIILHGNITLKGNGYLFEGVQKAEVFRNSGIIHIYGCKNSAIENGSLLIEKESKRKYIEFHKVTRKVISF